MGVSHYQKHRIALLPFILIENDRWIAETRDWIAHHGEAPLITFLVQQGLASFWYRLIQSQNAKGIFSNRGLETLRLATLNAAQVYLIQKHCLGTLNSALENNAISHVIFKGAHLREILYDQPHCRTACDIDILVSPEDKHQAIKAIMDQGYTLQVSATSISHEATLIKDNVSIDIHWDILRPGRTRQPMTSDILEQRQFVGGHWGPMAEHSLFLMLVHPVITKYATAPLSTINRLLDIIIFIRRVNIHWQKLQEILADSGLQTAAWIMLEWLGQVTGIQPPPAFIKAIEPGAAKRCYLRTWITGNYSTRLLRYHGIIRAAFTLPAHDTLSDVLRATSSLYREKQNVQANLDALSWATPQVK